MLGTMLKEFASGIDDRVLENKDRQTVVYKYIYKVQI